MERFLVRGLTVFGLKDGRITWASGLGVEGSNRGTSSSPSWGVGELV